MKLHYKWWTQCIIHEPVKTSVGLCLQRTVRICGSSPQKDTNVTRAMCQHTYGRGCFGGTGKRLVKSSSRQQERRDCTRGTITKVEIGSLESTLFRSSRRGWRTRSDTEYFGVRTLVCPTEEKGRRRETLGHEKEVVTTWK